MPYRLANSYQRFKESQCPRPLRLLNSEGEGIAIDWHIGNCHTTQRNILEDLNVHQHIYKNPNSCKLIQIIFKIPVATSQRTQSVTITKTSELMFR